LLKDNENKFFVLKKQCQEGFLPQEDYFWPERREEKSWTTLVQYMQKIPNAKKNRAQVNKPVKSKKIWKMKYANENKERVIRTRRMKCAVRVARKGEMRNAYKILMGNPQGVGGPGLKMGE
jgi:hypothetical protein